MLPGSMLPAALICLLPIPLVFASLDANINYRSPSLRHPSLGISIPKVTKRHTIGISFTGSELDFTHGVASGDPYSDSVVLWTRVAPFGADTDSTNVTVEGTVPLYDHDNEKYVMASTRRVCLDWKISADESLETLADEGRVETSSDVDWTVKVEATRLEPFTTYYYQFEVCDSDKKSPVGRTKTLPAPGEDVERNIRIAVFSCSNHPFGFFNSYGNVARKDSVDYVIHLGDYIYEYAEGHYGWGTEIGRIPEPNVDIKSLYDYRKRLAQYRSDTDLRLNHQKFAWMPTWDDHEIGDNIYTGGMGALNNTESSFLQNGRIAVDQRKMNAVRAYFEWMPLRQVDLDDGLRIWRTFEIGNLANLVILDTRVYQRSITDVYWNTNYIKMIKNDAGRSIMGAVQESWLYRQLRSSFSNGVKWRLIGTQVLFSRIVRSLTLTGEPKFNLDVWDGYVANRNRTLQVLHEENIDNTIFLSGDSHLNWVSDVSWYDKLPYDAESGDGSLAVEFSGTAVSSPSPFSENITQIDARARSEWLEHENGVSGLRWNEGWHRGYFELEIGYDGACIDYYGTGALSSIKERNGKEYKIASWRVLDGENRIERDFGGPVALGTEKMIDTWEGEKWDTECCAC